MTRSDDITVTKRIYSANSEIEKKQKSLSIGVIIFLATSAEKLLTRIETAEVSVDCR